MIWVTVTMPLIAVIGIVNRNKTRIKENNLPRNPSLVASIGFGLPTNERNLPIISIFHEAPIILPYARIVGPINTSPEIAKTKGRWDSSIWGIRNWYVAREQPTRPMNVIILLEKAVNLFDLPKVVFLPSN